MKIPLHIIPEAYDLSKKVYEGNLTLSEVKRTLSSKYEVSVSSTGDYVNNFRYLMDGRLFHRTLNAASMTYFLENIYHDYGPKRLSNALTALKLHIEYYENIQKVVMRKMREIYSKYLTISINDPDEYEQEEIMHELKREQKSKSEIASELKKLKPTDPEEITINAKSYKRDNKTIAQIKIYRDFKCQICSTTIKKKDGTFYIEAAHIEPKHKKGRETPDNILLLCPNHHKEFDYGDRNIFHHNKDEVHFALNGCEYKISIKIN